MPPAPVDRLSREEVTRRILALPTEMQEEAAQAALELYGPAELSFREHVDQVRPGYVWYRHCEIKAAALQRVADGELKRLMIFEPVRHGKTELLKLFASYLVRRFPERFVGTSSYGDELAYGTSRAARRFAQAAGVETAGDANAVKHWETLEGGGMWAAGAGGAIAGKGAHCLLLDDPIKGAKAAQSTVERESIAEWYDSVFTTRAEPGASIVITTTRWHEDDLVGRQLEREKEDPEGWYIINLPAIAEDYDDRPEFPESCTVEEDWREPGEPLCPERYPLPVLEKLRQTKPFWFATLYQQRPSVKGAEMFPKTAWQIVDAAPAGLRLVRYWDKASADVGRGDFTAGVLMGADDLGRYYILDVVHGQWPSDERNAVMAQTCQLDRVRFGRNRVRYRIEQPPGFGVEATKGAIRAMRGFVVKADPVRGE